MHHLFEVLCGLVKFRIRGQALNREAPQLPKEIGFGDEPVVTPSNEGELGIP